MGEYVRLCGKLNGRLVCADATKHVGHHSYVDARRAAAISRDRVEALALLRDFTLLRDGSDLDRCIGEARVLVLLARIDGEGKA